MREEILEQFMVSEVPRWKKKCGNKRCENNVSIIKKRNLSVEVVWLSGENK